MFKLVEGHFDGSKPKGFYFGGEITLVDFFVGALFAEINAIEPTLMPVWIGSYANLKPYFQLLQETL